MDSLASATPQELVRLVSEIRPKRPEHEPREKLTQVIRLLSESEKVLTRHIEQQKERVKVAYHLQEALNILNESPDEQTLAFLVQELKGVLPKNYTSDLFPLLEEELPEAICAIREKKDALIERTMCSIPEMENVLSEFLSERLLYEDILQQEDVAFLTQPPMYSEAPVVKHAGKIEYLNNHTRGWHTVHVYRDVDQTLASFAPTIDSWLFIEKKDVKRYQELLDLFTTEQGPVLGAKIFGTKFKGHRHVTGICDSRPIDTRLDLATVVKKFREIQAKKCHFTRVEIYERAEDTHPSFTFTCAFASGSGKLTVKVTGKQKMHYP